MNYNFKKMTRTLFVSTLVLSQLTALNTFATVQPNTVFAQNLTHQSNESALSNVSKEAENTFNDTDQVTVIVKIKEDTALDASTLTSESGKESRVSQTSAKREAVVSDLKNQGLSFDTLLEYDLLFNGFSAKMDYATAKSIAQSNQVESVEVSVEYSKPTETSLSLVNRQTETTNSVDSNKIININPVWQSGYKGEGTVVAIIDSGLDLEHDIFQLTDVSKAKYTSESDLNAKKQEAGISYGKWYSNKIIFAYNYNDQNDSIKESAKDSHGTHVAGISVGNPTKAIGTGEKVVGVAPEAQLMFMRVFSDVRSPGSTSSYIYAKAIEDAVKLGADSINLSLGSATGNVVEVGPAITQAVNMANAAGVVVSIAAGNDNSFGDSYANPDAKNPDYGLVGNPSVARDAISVAAINNNVIISDALTVVDKETNSKNTFEISVPNYEFPNQEFELVEAGLGEESDFKDKNLDGKIALVKRGKITFSEKATNASNAGAVGLIVYNHEDGGESVLSMNLSEGPSKFPVTSVGVSNGKYLVENIDKIKVLFDGNLVKKEHPNKNELTEFTSWGLSSDGELKPDLTAPGGDIYSSVNDGKYANMDGTSMASPHVAGVIALMKQSLAARYPHIKGEALQNLIKLLLMSTATPHFNTKEQAYTSPRQQGAGVVNTAKAITSDLYVTNAKNGYGSVSLGNIKEKFNFVVEVHNLSNQPKELSYVTEVVTDKVDADGKFALAPKFVASIPNGKVSVPANGSVKVPITVDTSAYTAELTTLMPNGYYLDGFVRFVDPVDSAEAVSIPYTGFKGSFENLAVLEKPIYDFDLQKEAPFYFYNLSTGEKDSANHFTYLKTQEVAADINNYGSYKTTANKILGEFLNYTTQETYFDTTKMAISPNGDNSYDFVELNTVFLRNYEKFQVVVKDKDGNRVYGGPISSGKKNYYAGRGDKSQVAIGSRFEGKDNQGNNLPDGQYTYEVTYRSETPGSKDQTFSYPLAIDRVAPEFTGGVYDATTRTYTPNKIKEEGTGLQYVALRTLDFALDEKGDFIMDSQNNPVMKAVDILPNADGTFTIPEGTSYDDYDIYAVDWAGNENDSTMKIQVNDLGQKGQIDVQFLVDGYSSDLKSFISRYVIKNSKGEVVTEQTRQKPVGIDALGDVIMRSVHLLPIDDTYTVELMLVDTDSVTMTTPTKFTVNLTRDNASQVVTFRAIEKFINTLTIEFNEELPEGSKVYVVDKDGNKTEVPQSKFIKTIHEKRFENEEYTIVVELPENYTVDQNDVKYTMVNGTNLVKFNIKKLVDKTALQKLVAEAKQLNLTDKTAETTNVLNRVLSESESILSNANATEQEVLDALNQLESAVKGLKTVEVKLGFVKLNNEWFYNKADGTRATGWLFDKQYNSWFYFDASGKMLENTWLFDKQYNSWFYLKAGGYLAQNEWVKTKDKWYYLKSGGYLAQNEWIKTKNKWYYLKSNGEMAVSEKTPDGYTVDATGAWVK